MKKVEKGGVYSHWKVLESVPEDKKYFCECIHCGTKKGVYKGQLLDERNKPSEISRCRSCNKKMENKRYLNFYGIPFTVLKYYNSSKILIQFDPDDLCLEGYTKYVTKYNILTTKNIPYPFHRSIYGVGYTGEEHGNIPTDVHIKDVWIKMIKRCYSPCIKDKVYIKYLVCDEWHSYYNFYKWYKSQTTNGYYFKGYQIDKDFLDFGKNLYKYSPETCRLIPEKINSFLNNFEDTRNTGTPSGVTWKAKNNKYQIQIKDEYSRKVYLGLVDDPLEGYVLYCKEKERVARALAVMYEGLVVPEILQVLRSFKCPSWDWEKGRYNHERIEDERF